MRVLIIEDEDHIRRMMRLTLEATYDVAEAASGEEGLIQFGDGTGWDAILLDQRLPGIDGLETLRQIRQRCPDACVIMITAFASIELAVDAMKHGAVDFLRKPTTPEGLRGAVAAAIDHKATRPRRPASAGTGTPDITHLTMNGFQILRQSGESGAATTSPYEHRFIVVQFPDGEKHEVIVTVAAEEVARVTRLTRRDLKPEGGFWRDQAERLLAGHLWTKGRIPHAGRLTLTEVSRDAIDLAAAWTRTSD